MLPTKFHIGQSMLVLSEVVVLAAVLCLLTGLLFATVLLLAAAVFCIGVGNALTLYGIADGIKAERKQINE